MFVFVQQTSKVNIAQNKSGLVLWLFVKTVALVLIPQLAAIAVVKLDGLENIASAVLM